MSETRSVDPGGPQEVILENKAWQQHWIAAVAVAVAAAAAVVAAVLAGCLLT